MNRATKSSLFNLMEESCGSMVVMNRDAYLSKKHPMLNNIEEVEQSLNLDDEKERFMYVEWYYGPLASWGALMVVNKENDIVRSKTIWMS